MALWTGQTPGDTILTFSVTILDSRICIEIDKPKHFPTANPAADAIEPLPKYRLTAGTLFHYHEVLYSNDLEEMLVHANRITQASTLKQARRAIGVDV